jgi:glycine cleavage system H protein
MSEIPNGLQYTSDHEWLRKEQDGSVVVGITDHAQDSLGELVFVELPEVDARFDAGDACAVVESVKAASDVYAPVSGTVAEVNQRLGGSPELVNDDPYGEGWLFRLAPDSSDAAAELLSAERYAELLAASED